MLILVLPLQPDASLTHEFSFVQSIDGRTASLSGRASPAQLPASLGEVVAVVPWQRLSWHNVTLPPQSGGRLQAVLHGLMEEQLLDDPSQLHLVAAPSSPLRQGGATQVCACSRTWLSQALAPLTAAGIRVQRIVPECAPSLADPVLQLLPHDGHPLGLLRDAQGVTPIPRASVAAWSTALAGVSACWVEPAVSQEAAHWSTVDPVLQTPAQRWLSASQSDWDLAQGEWGQSRSQRSGRWLQKAWQVLRHDPAWRPVRWGLGLLLLIQVLGLNVWAWRERAQLQAQARAQQGILTDTFPHVRVVIDPLLQMQREVTTLRQAAGVPSPQDFDTLLARLSEALPPQASVQHISYSAGELRWKAPASSDLDGPARERLYKQGYRLSTQGDLQRLSWEGSR